MEESQTKGESLENNKPSSDVLFSWEGPARPYKKRDASFYQTTAALVFLLIVILFFVREFLIIGVVLSVVFVSFVLAANAPPFIKHQITEKGVWVDDVFYRFTMLSEYWFEDYLDNQTLVFVAPSLNAQHIVVVIDRDKKEKIDSILRKRLVFREKPLKSFVDRAGEWLKNKIPLEEKKNDNKPSA